MIATSQPYPHPSRELIANYPEITKFRLELSYLSRKFKLSAISSRHPLFGSGHPPQISQTLQILIRHRSMAILHQCPPLTTASSLATRAVGLSTRKLAGASSEASTSESKNKKLTAPSAPYPLQADNSSSKAPCLEDASLYFDTAFPPLVRQLASNGRWNPKLVASCNRLLAGPWKTNSVAIFPQVMAVGPMVSYFQHSRSHSPGLIESSSGLADTESQLTSPRSKHPASKSSGEDAANRPPATKSYRDAVSASWSKQVDVSLPSAPAKAPSIFNGEPALFISEKEEQRLAQRFRHALIG